MIIAHRGYRKDVKENTIPAFEKAFLLGADAIECDIRLTKDKELVVHHNNEAIISGKQLRISKTRLSEIIDIRGESKNEISTLDELLDYAVDKKSPFFLEVKNSSSFVTKSLISKIRKRNLWSKIHIIGFPFLLKNTLRAQEEYPELKVMPFVIFPIFSCLIKPQKSYGVFLGWLEDIWGSRRLFKLINSKKRLFDIHKYYKKYGIKVMAGVINDKDGFELFKHAGIEDVVTDNIPLAIDCFKKL